VSGDLQSSIKGDAESALLKITCLSF